jgi:hypothetical protein
METIFSLSGLLTIPFWLLIIFLPKWSWTERLMKSVLVIVPAAVAYTLLVLPRFVQIFPAVLNPQLPEIASLLGSHEGATIGWIHFLAFDLFVGRWVYVDSRQRDLNPFLMAPILFFVMMLGPFGLLLYLTARALLKGGLDETGGRNVAL